MEIAIRRRPRLRVVLDFNLRARLTRFHGRALFSNFDGVSIGGSNKPENILCLNDNNIPRKKSDDGTPFWR